MKHILFSKIVGPWLRHGATLVGGMLIANGWADEATAEAITGGLVAVGGVVLSIIEKEAR